MAPRRSRRAARAAMASGVAGALALSTALFADPAAANPANGTVAAGQATIVQSTPSRLDVVQTSDKAIINWGSFSIGAGEHTNFQQPSSSSVTLNRVTGGDPSAILGRLTANGTVMLVNPNGIVFGPTAKVDVGSLVATTANIADKDFLAGKNDFKQASANPNAMVVNQGEISVKDTGLAALVAPGVKNSGVIRAKLGTVALAGAKTFALDFHGDGLISFGVGSEVTEAPRGADGQPVKALVQNSGSVIAEGGVVAITARAVKSVVDQAINTDGIVAATSVGSKNGKIVLDGGEGTVQVAGTIDATGKGASEKGGTVTVTGRAVEIAGTATVDASGRNEGGTVLIGGDQRGGRDASARLSATPVRTASTVKVATGAKIRADGGVTGTAAKAAGKGGKVVVWSDERTDFAGAISARGGALGGDGGSAEVSSAKDITLTGTADLSAELGTAGTFLLDPASLRIVSGSGSLDGDAADGTIGSGDPSAGSGDNVNTVSAGVLNGIAGNASIVLESTGLISVETDLGLQTTTGHSFTLRSTDSGGITFFDGVGIATAGGDIRLEAKGVGSSITNVGALNSNNGNISLVASAGIGLAGAVEAGTGTVSVQSNTGSITAGSGASLGGAAVSLSARDGDVGRAGTAVATATEKLSVQSGGSIVVVNDGTLTELAIASTHTVPGSANAYQITSDGLAFDMADGGGYEVRTIAQDGLALSFTGDRSIAIGTIDVGAADARIISTGGDLTDTGAGNGIKAGTLTLRADGSMGSNGAIGTYYTPLRLDVADLTAIAGTGAVNLANAGALNLERLTAAGTASVTAGGDLTVGDVTASTLTLASTKGGVLDDGDAATIVTASTATIEAGTDIGADGKALATKSSYLTLQADGGGIRIGNTASSLTVSSAVAGDGPIALSTTGALSLNNVVSTAGKDVQVSAAGLVTVGAVNAGTTGDVTITTADGSIQSSGASQITGDAVTLTAGGSSSGIYVQTAANVLTASAGMGGITVSEADGITLASLITGGMQLSVTSAGGDVTIGTLRADGSSFGVPVGGIVSVTAQGGSILDDGKAATGITGSSVTLSSAGDIGSSAASVGTTTGALTLRNRGDIYLADSDVLTSLSIDNAHVDADTSNTLKIVSPYLAFDVADSKGTTTLKQVAGTQLNSLSFTSDRNVAIGQVQASSISIKATSGDLVDDGNAQTRATATSITLEASAGGIGTAAAPVGINTTTLTATTRGNLYLTNIGDFASLTINAGHQDSKADYGFGITAQGMTFAVKDTADGLEIDTLTDRTGITLSLTNDRSLVLGNVDGSPSGTINLTSTQGSILDDGDDTTRLVANNVTFSAANAIGASGNAIDLSASTLQSATASSGGIYISVPTPAGSANTTNALTLSSVYAYGGPIDIRAAWGDLAIGSVTGGQAVTIEAANGSVRGITNVMGPGIPMPSSGGSISAGGKLALTARDAIGLADAPISLSAPTMELVAGQRIDAAVSGSTTLALAQATGDITLTAGGTLTVGKISSGAGSVALGASSGIRNDGDTKTAIQASKVVLSAGSAGLGTSAAPLDVESPDVTLVSGGDVWMASTGTSLSALTIQRTSSLAASYGITAPGLTFSVSEDASGYYLQNIQSKGALDFTFSGVRAVKIGSILDGDGAVSLTTTGGDITNDGGAGSGIAAKKVSLATGANSSIGAAGDGSISLVGTTDLTLTAGRNIFAGSDVALASLSVTSTGIGSGKDYVNAFGITGLDGHFDIADDGTTYTLGSIGGKGLQRFSFSGTNARNLVVGSINASDAVSLSLSGSGDKGTITSDGSGGRVTAAAVSVSATGGSGTTSGTIGGAGASRLRTDAGSLTISTDGSFSIDNNKHVLSALDITTSHRYSTVSGNSYLLTGIGAGRSFSLSDGSSQTLALTSADTRFSYSGDRALRVGTVNTGTGGAVSLTVRSGASGADPSINNFDSSSLITAGSVSLTAAAYRSSIGTSQQVRTSTAALSVTSGGSVNISNSKTLSALDLDFRHSSGSSTQSYSIGSTGLTFSVSDSTNYGLQVANISQSGLALSIKNDRGFVISNISTGAGAGSVSLTSTGSILGQSGGAAYVTSGSLSLTGTTVGTQYSSTPFLTQVGSLSSDVTTISLSNTGDLALVTNVASTSADIAASGSITQSGGGYFTTPTLKLTAASGSLGASGAALLTDARSLTTVSGKDLNIANKSDLFALDVTANNNGGVNLIQVQADGLDFVATNKDAGATYDLAKVVDANLNFGFHSNTAISLGEVSVGQGGSLKVESTTSAITRDGVSGALLSGGSISLDAAGWIGSADAHLLTSTADLSLRSGGSIFVENARDLSRLAITATQMLGGPVFYSITNTPSLTFSATDAGLLTLIDEVTDTTGLDFSLNTQHGQAIRSIDVGPSGSVTLASAMLGILGSSYDAGDRITAGSVSLTTTGGGTIGIDGIALFLSTPLLTINNSGSVFIASDTHIDALSIDATHSSGASRSYGLTSVSPTGDPVTFVATDDGTKTVLTTLTDTQGLAFSFRSDRAITVGNLDLGQIGTVSLYGPSGIADDADDSTRITAGTVTLTSSSGALGGAGAAQGLDLTTYALSAAGNNGVYLGLAGRTKVSSIMSGGAVVITNTAGDIDLGTVQSYGNPVTVDNQGGSILSGSISYAGTVALSAQGSIGSVSAIGITANGSTTTLTASAVAANGAAGSIAISESYGLNAKAVTADGDITLTSGQGALTVGTVASAHGSVELTAGSGNLTGNDGNNLVSGKSITLNAQRNNSSAIGSSATPINVATTSLTLNSPAGIFVADSADLDSLTIDRSTSSSGGSGAIEIAAKNLTWKVTDTTSLTTLTTVSDTTGLDFTFNGVHGIAVGTVNTGSDSSVTLNAGGGGTSSITQVEGGAGITAGTLKLTASGNASQIGAAGAALKTAVSSVSASSGTGGVHFTQTGSLAITDISTSGDIVATVSKGDLTIGSLNFTKNLTLEATTGSILSGGAPMSIWGPTSAVSLKAANGIGTELAPILLYSSNSVPVTATVTGEGSLYLNSLYALNGGLIASVADGSINVQSVGNILLKDVVSKTDAAGNDIKVVSTAGNIVIGSVKAGATAGRVTLQANSSTINAADTTSEVSAHGVDLIAAYGVGSSGLRVGASGDDVKVVSTYGSVYLAGSVDTTYSQLSAGGTIDIAATADVAVVNAASSSGNINIVTSGAGNDILVGSIDAGLWNATLKANEGELRDDGDAGTRIRASDVTLGAASGIGSADAPIQTTANVVNATVTGTGDIHLDETDGVNLALKAHDGAIFAKTGGYTVLGSAVVETDGTGKNIALAVDGGDLLVIQASAGTTSGTVDLSATGSITGSLGFTNITAATVALTSGGDIGTVVDLATGAGTPLTLNAGSISKLSATKDGSIVSVRNVGLGTLKLGTGAVSLGEGSSAYITAAGNLDVSSGINLSKGNLLLDSAGVLTLPSSGSIGTTGVVTLRGKTDVVAAGGGRTLSIEAPTLIFSSGSAGGATTLNTKVGTLTADLTGKGDLWIDNDGALTVDRVSTSDGSLFVKASDAMTVTSAVVGGIGHTLSLTTSAGDLSVSGLDAGIDGALVLEATQARILGLGGALAAKSVSLTNAVGIGSAAERLAVNAETVSAKVTGTGDIYLDLTAGGEIAGLQARDGVVDVTAAKSITVTDTVEGKSVTLSSGGTVTLGAPVAANGTDGDVAVTGSGIVLQSAPTVASGNITFTGPTTIGSGITLAARKVTFDGSVNDSKLGMHDLSITGEAVFTGNVGQVTSLRSLTVDGTFSGHSVSTTGAQDYRGAATLNGSYLTSHSAFTVAGPVTLAGTTTVGTGSGDIAFKGTVDGAAVLSTVSTGTTTFDAAVGGTTALLAYHGRNGTISAQDFTTAGNQVFEADAVLDGTYKVGAGAFSVSGAAQLAGPVTVEAATIQLLGPVDGKQALVAKGDTLLGGAVGFTTALASLDVTGATTLLGGKVITTGAQRYDGAVMIGADTLVKTSDAAVDFLGPVDGGKALTVETGTGDIGFAGMAGGRAALGAVRLNSSGATVISGPMNAGSVITDAAGTLALDAGNVNTGGSQSWGENAVLGADTTLSGTMVTFGGTVDGAHSLYVIGDATFAKTVGGTVALRSVMVDGRTTLVGPAVTTTEAQSYHGGMVLGTDVTLTGSQIGFGGAVDGVVAGIMGLTVQGDASFGGDVGQAAALEAITVHGETVFSGGSVATTGAQLYDGAASLNGSYTTKNAAFTVTGPATLTGATGIVTGSGAITFADTVDGAAALSIASLATSRFQAAVGGTTALASVKSTGGTVELLSVTTEGSQSYGSDVVLNGSYAGKSFTVGGKGVLAGGVTVTAGTIGFGGTVNGAEALTLTGDATFGGAVGGTTALTSLAVTGASALNGGAVTTVGTQRYDGAVVLGANTVLQTTDAAVDFLGTVNGYRALTVSTGTGSIGFAGAVGGTTMLNAITLNSSGATTLSGTVRAESVTTDAAGTLALNGGNVVTGGAQSWGEDATLGTDTVLTGTQVTFGGTLDGTHGLKVMGNAAFTKAVGGTEALDTLYVYSTAALDGGSVTTTGTQLYGGPVTLGADTTLTGTKVTFAGTVDAATAGGQGLTIAGDAEFRASVGDAHAALAGLDVSGTTALNGWMVRTTGTQRYAGAVTLGSDMTVRTSDGAVTFLGTVDGGRMLFIEAGAGDIGFAGAVGGTTALGAVTLNSSGATTLSGTVRAASVTTSARGTLALNGGSVTTTGAQSWGEDAVLGTDTVLTGTSVTFGGTLNGAHALDVMGNAAFAKAVGGTTALDGVHVSGTTALNGPSVTTTGTQAYDGPATLGSSVTLAGTEVTFAGTLDAATAGAQGLTVQGDATFGGAVGFHAALAKLDVSGTSALNGGMVTTTGTQRYDGAVVLGADTVVKTSDAAVDFLGTVDGGHALTVSAGSGGIGFADTVGRTGMLGAIVLNSSGATVLSGMVKAASVTTDAGGTLALNGGSVNTAAGQIWGEDATLGADTVLKGSNVTFGGTLDGAHDLSVIADVTFAKAVGGTVALRSVTVDGDTVLTGPAVTTTGAQSYQGATVLGTDVILTGSQIGFGGTVDGVVAGIMGLTVQGDATFGGDVGQAAALEAITVHGGTVFTGGSVATTGAQLYDGTASLNGSYTTKNAAFTVTGPATLTGATGIVTGSGAITFADTVDGAAALSIASLATSRFQAAVGGTTALASVKSTGGTVELLSVTTEGSQSYGSDVVLNGSYAGKSFTVGGKGVLAGGVTVTAGTIGFGGTVNGAEALTLTGDATFGGAVGGTTALTSLAVTGASALNGGAVTTVGTQRYDGAVVLGANTVLQTTDAAVDFLGTVNGYRALTVSTGTGSIGFAGAVGGTTMLNAITLNSSGATTLSGTVRAESVTTDAAGTLALNGGNVVTGGAQSWGEDATLGTDTVLTGSAVTFGGTLDGTHGLKVMGNAAFTKAVGGTEALASVYVYSTAALDGGSVTTTGTQLYGGPVALGADTTLTGTKVTFAGTVDAATAGGQGLTIAGDAEFRASVGDAHAALAGLDVSGTTALNGWMVRTTGTQRYAGAVTLGSDMTVRTSDGSVTFLGTVDGGRMLFIEAGAGDIGFAGAVGGTTALGAVTLNSSGATTLSGTVRAASVTTNARGTLALDGGSVTTTGAQSWGEDAVLGTDTVLTGTSVTFGGTLDGAHALDVIADVTFAKTVGGTVALRSVMVDGRTTLVGPAVTTTEAQSYQGATVLGTDVILTGSQIGFGGTVDGVVAGIMGLTVQGDATFGGDVGQAAALEAITVHGGTVFTGGSVATTGAQLYDGTASLNGSYTTKNAAFTVTGPATLTGATGIVTGSGAITFADTVDGAAALSIASLGTSRFQAAVGGTTALASVKSTGGTVELLSVTTEGSQSYGSDVVLNGSYAGKSFTVGGKGVLAGGVTVTAGTIGFGGTVNGAEALTLTGDATFGGAVGGTTALTSLAVTGASALNGGAVTTVGTQRYDGAVVLGADTVLQTTDAAVDFLGTVNGGHALAVSTGSGSIGFAGAVGGTTALEAVTLNSSGATTLLSTVKAASITTDAGGTVALNGGSVTTSGAQSWGEDATLGTDTVLTGSAVAFGGTLDGAHDLNVVGNATFAKAVGGTEALDTLYVSGTTAMNGPSVTTTGGQLYGEAVTLGTDVTLTATEVGFFATLDAATAGGQSLAVKGDATFGGAVGGNAALSAVDVSGSASFYGGEVVTTGTQTYGEDALLGTDTVLTGTVVTFSAGLDALAAGQQGLRIAGDAVLGKAGAEAVLASLTVDGTTTFTGGSIATEGDQTYTGAATLAAGTQLVTGGGAVTFSSTLDGGNALAVAANGGDVTFVGTVGGTTRLGALTVDSDGETAFRALVKAASVTTDAPGTLVLSYGVVDTTGTQRYGENTDLVVDTTLTGSTVTFGGTLDAANAGVQSLTVNGNAAFEASVGSRRALESIDVSGTTLFATPAVTLPTFTLYAKRPSGFSVTTVGTQSYAGAATLAADVTLNGSTILFGVGPSAATAGGQALTVNGDVVLGDAGGAGALARFTVNGATTLRGGTITTMGSQTYNGAATLGGATVLASNGGPVTFAATLDGGQDLTVNADGGDVTFAGTVGGMDRLGALVVNTAGETAFDALVQAASVTTDAPGTLALNHGVVDTTGEQSYGENFNLVVDTELTGSVVRFGGRVGATDEGEQDLTINGDAEFARDIGRDLGEELHPELGKLTITGVLVPTRVISINTLGDLKIGGIFAPGLGIEINTGAAMMKIGLPGGGGLMQLDVGALTVQTAGSAQLYGRIGGIDGVAAAGRIDSTLRGAPYFINDTPWGVLPISGLVSTPMTSFTNPFGVTNAVLSSLSNPGGLFGSGSLSNLGLFSAPNVLTFGVGGGVGTTVGAVSGMTEQPDGVQGDPERTAN